MPEKAAQFRFRADVEDRPAHIERAWPVGGWVILAVAGLCVGLAIWFGGRSLLERDLRQQLAVPTSSTESLMAIEGLAKLDTDAQFEIVSAIGGQDDDAARLAYRVLDTKLADWSSLANAERIRRMLAVVDRLGRIPESIAPERKVFTGALASRILSFTVLDAELAEPTLRSACQALLHRANQAALGELHTPASQPASSSDGFVSQGVGRAMILSAPPPPLAPVESIVAQAVPDPSNNSMHLKDLPPEPSVPQLPAPTNSCKSVNDNAAVRLISDNTASISDTSQQGQPALLDSASPKRSFNESVRDGSSTKQHVASVALTPGMRSNTSFTVNKDSADFAAEQRPESMSNGQFAAEEKGRSVDYGAATNAELLRLLSNLSPQISQSAALELRRRGTSDQLLQVASELASGTSQVRLRILEDLVRLRDINPRPWLLWMAEQGEPPVRKKAVAMLASLADADVRRELRLLLNRERDEEVALVIRQALVSGPIIR